MARHFQERIELAQGVTAHAVTDQVWLMQSMVLLIRPDRRPCDGVETAADGPTCLILSRQALTPMARTDAQVADIARGGYVLVDCAAPQVVLLATGSEVEIAVAVARQLDAARVVSLPCVELFMAQGQAYRDAVLPPGVPRVSVEAGVTWFWRALVGETGATVGLDFGESAPAGQLYEYFGITAARVAAIARTLA